MESFAEKQYSTIIPSVYPTRYKKHEGPCLSPEYCENFYNFTHAHALPYSLECLDLSLKNCNSCKDRRFLQTFDNEHPTLIKCLTSIKALIETLMSSRKMTLKKVKKTHRQLKMEHEEAIRSMCSDDDPPLTEIKKEVEYGNFPFQAEMEFFFSKKRRCPCYDFQFEKILEDPLSHEFRKLQKLIKIRSAPWYIFKPAIDFENEQETEMYSEYETYDDTASSDVTSFEVEPMSHKIFAGQLLSYAADEEVEFIDDSFISDVTSYEAECFSSIRSKSPVRPEANPLFETIPPGDQDDLLVKLHNKHCKSHCCHGQVHVQIRPRGRKSRKLKKQEKKLLA